MAIQILFVLLLLLARSSLYATNSLHRISEGFSLSVEKPTEDIITSPNGVLSAGFYAVGINAYCFAIWFTTKPHGEKSTVIWMANRDKPVNGNQSNLSLLRNGNLILTDAGDVIVWATNTFSNMSTELILKDSGNLVLEVNSIILWQSFDFPTNTLLPGQYFTRHTELVSSRSDSNHSLGFYKLSFDNDNVLRLLYDGPEISSVYWPEPWLVSWEGGRSTYNGSRIAVLDSLGSFTSSDELSVVTSDYGAVLQRRLILDTDGNIRVYSRENGTTKWYVSWQAITFACKVHGICGANSTCSYDHSHGIKCSCLPGYKMKNHTDWFYGCEPDQFHISCDKNESSFLEMQGVEFYGYDYKYHENYTYAQCKDFCLQLCNCKGFQHSPNRDNKGYFDCYPKTLLLNGRHSPGFKGTTYLRVPRSFSFSDREQSVRRCDEKSVEMLPRVYVKKHVNSFLRFFTWLAIAVGLLEAICIFLVWCFLIRTRQNSGADHQGYHVPASKFKKFTYSELKKATRGFSQEIGRGAGGIVYKGILSDERIAAIKMLNDANQGEGEFLAEVSIIGRLNHMNLIEIWGYCAEGKHRLLVYEFMENGSLAENLFSNKLDWSKRYEIAAGTARGLAYLHEECLEWVLHCDIKPQNILLDSNYQPKVADFGLSKLLNRNNLNNSSFSRIRGTRGYMAPEWLFNLPITSKVDVYSYGIVILEMITRKSSTTGIQTIGEIEEQNHGRLVTWVREKRSKRTEVASWVEEIIDPAIEPSYDIRRIEILARVALDCVEEDKDVRPTMRQVVEMLQYHENDFSNQFSEG